MTPSDRPASGRTIPILIAAALIAAGIALSFAVFYPGYMTIDASWVYKSIASGLGDWQSPVMSVVWKVIDPIAPGSMSMFLLQMLLYWGGFALVAATVARCNVWLGVLTALLAFLPPAFMFIGMIWRDVLFAGVWLCAAALTYATAGRRGTVRWLVLAVAMTLVALGLLFRPNAIIAAPFLVAYALWPSAFQWKRAIAIVIPAIIAGYALIQVTYYTVLHAERQNPLHSVFVFDLGGITYFSGENRFPVTFTPQQTAMLFTTDCYHPTRWDYYWHIVPCDFVMKRLENKEDLIFGTPRLVTAWRDAVLAHPLAYLKHRATFMWTLLAEPTLVLPILELPNPERRIHATNRFFMTMITVHDWLQPTWLLRTGPWLVIALAVCGLAWPLRLTPHGAFAYGTAGSSVVYVLSFFPFGVSAEFRYVYWCVLASLVGGVAVLAGRCAAASARRHESPTASHPEAA